MGVHVGPAGGPRSGSDGDDLRPVLRHGRGHARAAAQHAKAKHTAKSIEAGRYDLVLDPSHLWLTIHESVGHPLELDRVLGYEANYAGTSFATLDKWKTGSFKYGSEHVNLVADKTQPNSLGAVGYDDEGVKTKKWDLVRKGILTNYQAIRDQVHILGQNESHGCCYADSWSSVQFQRMPNVSLEPGEAPMTPAQMIAGVDGASTSWATPIRSTSSGTTSSSAGRCSTRFAAGKSPACCATSPTSPTPRNLEPTAAVCDRRDYRLGGSFFDGKGQPPQISAVSHGSATARFNNVNVLNTARKI